MEETTYDDGYREGWAAIAGDRPLPTDPRPRPADPFATYAAGYAYGRLDAIERFVPLGPCPGR
jgi:hypothetical protein